MIEYLLTAFFIAQPPGTPAPAGAAPPRAGATSPRLQAPVEISSRRVTGSRDQATFSGDVVVKQRTLDLRCDEMTASYTGPREVTRVACGGHMRLVDGERTAQGERAVLDVPTGAIEVTGEPEAHDATTRLRGSRMRLVMGAPPGFEYEVDDATVVLEAAPLTLSRKPGAKDGPGARLPAEVTARKVVGSRSQAVFTGDVVVKHRTLELRCDKMIATYTAAREVTRAECVGHVRATDGDRQVRGERAVFRVPTGLLVVTGNPEARDATTHLKGSEVRMTVGDANFEVRDAVVTVESAKPPPSPPTHPPAGGMRKP
jgi:lipopolysaccharide export system protein LptA